MPSSLLGAILQAQGPPDPRTLEGLPTQQKIVAVTLAVVMLVVVVELVRKRKLREEYSVLWTLTAVALLLLAIQPPLLNVFKSAIGAVEPIPALLFGGILFLMCLSLQFSIRLSKLTFRNRTLSQRIALLEKELTEVRKRQRESGSQPPAGD